MGSIGDDDGTRLFYAGDFTARSRDSIYLAFKARYRGVGERSRRAPARYGCVSWFRRERGRGKGVRVY